MLLNLGHSRQHNLADLTQGSKWSPTVTWRGVQSLISTVKADSLPKLLLLRTYGGDTAESRNTPLSPRTLPQINTTHCQNFKEISTEVLTYHNTMHDVAKCKENCHISTITTVQILCCVNRKSDRNTLQILLTVAGLQAVHCHSGADGEVENLLHMS